MASSERTWEQIVQAKRTQRARLVESQLERIENGDKNGLLDSIVELDDVDELIARLSSGRLSAVDLASSYIKRAIEAHQNVNCLTEIGFTEALEDAAKLDEYYRKNGKLIGPLHGIPTTLKDQFDVKGLDSTIGYVARAFQPAIEDGTLVKLLRELGAVILAKTNLPQSIMWCETENPIFGLTVNPTNADFTPGGSTGGEGALLSLHGSVVGWGTDIGGSIRIPSHMNGLWGLKPTSSRLPYKGLQVSTDGQGHVPSSVGPMTRSLSTLVTVMKGVIDSKPWTLDPNVTPIPWQMQTYEEIQSRRLTIGVLIDDGVVKVHPPIERALKELIVKLEAAGHDIIPWDNSGHKECIEIMDLFYSADGGEDIRREVEAGGEPFIPHVQALVNRGKAISVYDYWQLNKRKVAAQQAYNQKWNDTKGSRSGKPVDIILMPTMPHCAVPHRACRWVGYTKIWNILDYSALSFPAGKVNGQLDTKPEEVYEPRNDLEAWNWALYDPETMNGHPIGLQIVGRRFEEEKVLGAAAVIEKLLHP